MPCKFRDDTSNGSGVIVSTDRQTDKRTLVKTLPPSLRGWYILHVAYHSHYDAIIDEGNHVTNVIFTNSIFRIG